MTLPHTTPFHWPSIRPGRFAETIATTDPAECRIALLGLPDDLGIRLNRGRPGAAKGPRAFREALSAYGTVFDAREKKCFKARVFDAGDIIPATGDDESSLLETHRRVEQAVAALHAASLMPVCIGGGHDLTLPAVSALSHSVGNPVGGVNFDAHLDVRTTIGSGMPFRRLIESGALNANQFLEFGIGRFTCDEDDLRWLREQGSSIVLRDELTEAHGLFQQHFSSIETGFVSIDLDGIDSSHAPGVSAINPMGLSVSHAVSLAELAGREAKVKHFDIMELSPPHDQDGRTARVAAMIFLSFVAGFEARHR
jgi:formimidoylglutamase